MTTYYYGTKRETGGFRGRVYHYDKSGEKEIEVYVGPLHRFSGNSVLGKAVKALAIDDAAEWLEEHDLEANADGSW